VQPAEAMRRQTSPHGGVSVSQRWHSANPCLSRKNLFVESRLCHHGGKRSTVEPVGSPRCATGDWRLLPAECGTQSTSRDRGSLSRLVDEPARPERKSIPPMSTNSSGFPSCRAISNAQMMPTMDLSGVTWISMKKEVHGQGAKRPYCGC
jgi:hypothetical protein